MICNLLIYFHLIFFLHLHYLLALFLDCYTGKKGEDEEKKSLSPLTVANNLRASLIYFIFAFCILYNLIVLYFIFSMPLNLYSCEYLLFSIIFSYRTRSIILLASACYILHALCMLDFLHLDISNTFVRLPSIYHTPGLALIFISIIQGEKVSFLHGASSNRIPSYVLSSVHTNMANQLLRLSPGSITSTREHHKVSQTQTLATMATECHLHPPVYSFLFVSVYV